MKIHNQPTLGTYFSLSYEGWTGDLHSAFSALKQLSFVSSRTFKIGLVIALASIGVLVFRRIYSATTVFERPKEPPFISPTVKNLPLPNYKSVTPGDRKYAIPPPIRLQVVRKEYPVAIEIIGENQLAYHGNKNIPMTLESSSLYLTKDKLFVTCKQKTLDGVQEILIDTITLKNRPLEKPYLSVINDVVTLVY